MGRRIVVVTDSTANLPPEFMARNMIPTIPLTIAWGGETYTDGVTLPAETFYRWLEEREEFPQTSQPAVGEFVKFFQSVAQRTHADVILGIFISMSMSGTIAAAIQAQQMLPELQIEIVDSQFVSMSLGFQVIEAVQAAEQGCSLEEILALVARVRENTTQLIAVDTLEYLHRGGRIGGAARLMGSLLHLKPLLHIVDGQIESLEKIRTRQKCLRRMLEVAEEQLAGRRPLGVNVIDVLADDVIDEFTDEVVERLNPINLYSVLATPVVGGHAGPGTLGLGFYTLD
ncbi:MAG: DegV family protein [Chloroflexota bacterium]|nr:DegV family protein [Chloroflexota bacterium]